MSTKIKLRNDITANWAANNPILAESEQGYETDTSKLKIGDGVKNWNDLDYFIINNLKIGNDGEILFNDNGILNTDPDLFWDNIEKSLGIGTKNPTARLHLPAGTATANSSPLKFISGTLLTIPEVGSMEFNNDDLYFSISTTKAIIAEYPPAQSNTYVKATTFFSGEYRVFYATDPTLSLIGSMLNTSWLSANGELTNQRFHIDLGSAKLISVVQYNNNHFSGGSANRGVRSFTMWGSNTASDFADLVYANDGTWTQLTTSVSEFNEHSAVNEPDTQTFTVTTNTAYRYYAFKFANSWGGPSYMSLRHVELQSGTDFRKGIILNDGDDLVSERIPYATTNGRLIDSAGLTFDGTDLNIVGAITGGGLGHDQFSDYVANEHIDWTNASNNLKTSGTGEFKSNLRISDTATGNPWLRFYQDTTLKAALQYIDTGDYFRIEDNGIVGFIQQSGKVGIGGIQPTADLDVMVPATRTLGGTLGDYQIIASLGGRSSNLIRNSLWLVRNAAGTDWTTATLHDAISTDFSFATPGTDTKTWWERDFQGNIQSWGNAAIIGMTLTGTALDVVGDFTAGTIQADDGITGSWVNAEGKTVTVTGGIITNIA